MPGDSLVSLFSGAMGLDLGLHAAGFETVACAETDEACLQTIRKNRPKLKVYEDVRDVTKASVGEAPCLVAGGPPCQSFSTMGKRGSLGDPRGQLVFEFERVVSELKPRFFVMENVKGLVSSGNVLGMILGDFEGMGYKVAHGVVDAVDYGVPQFRERLLVVGSRDGEDVFVPAPTHFQRHQLGSMRWRTLGDAIQWLEDPGEFKEFPEERKRWLEKIPPGGNWKSLAEAEQKEAMKGAFDSRGGKTGFYRRLSFDEPSPTLVTSPAQKATLLCHPVQTRPLGTNEYKAIQQFPNYWGIEGSVKDVYRQVGNAVPVGLGEAIGRALRAVMQGVATVRSDRKAPRQPMAAEDELDRAARAENPELYA
jgi:DNA (cytosine-5)-methyltransferase 1